jgi:hypothetical protein
MGIYETDPVISDRQHVGDGAYDTWTETFKHSSGYVEVSQVIRVRVSKVWETCYCCSCGEDIFGGMSNDAACRNHGFAATRPCELHGTAGVAWGEEGGPEREGTMPDSVQAQRRGDAQAKNLIPWSQL